MTTARSGTPSPGDALFDRVVVGIDETPESLVAAAQARTLCGPTGRLSLVAVAETYLAAHAGVAAGVAAGHVEDRTSAALERARELVRPDETELVSGRLGDALCAACSRADATLAVVGVRPHRRLASATFGGHEVDVLRHAACSVLVARPGWGPSAPGRIVFGVDASPEGRAAEAVARAVAARLDVECVPVVPIGGDVAPGALHAEPDALLDPRDPVSAVAAAAPERALVVVGHARDADRAWRGTLAERIVGAVRCSVLVVRTAEAAA